MTGYEGPDLDALLATTKITDAEEPKQASAGGRPRTIDRYDKDLLDSYRAYKDTGTLKWKQLDVPDRNVSLQNGDSVPVGRAVTLELRQAVRALPGRDEGDQLTVNVRTDDLKPGWKRVKFAVKLKGD